MKAHADRADFTVTSDGCRSMDVAKSRFLAACAEWADQLIAGAIKSKERNNDIRAIKPEDFIPKVAYGENAKTAASDAVLLFLGEAYKLVTETMGTSQVVREALERAYRANINRDYALGPAPRRRTPRGSAQSLARRLPTHARFVGRGTGTEDGFHQ